MKVRSTQGRSSRALPRRGYPMDVPSGPHSQFLRHWLQSNARRYRDLLRNIEAATRAVADAG
jgi:hypothetical protein